MKTEIELILDFKNGVESAGNELILRNEGLVRGVFERHFKSCGAPEEDMLQEGRLGLLRAIEKFDGEKSQQFTLYKIIWIKKKMYSFRGKFFKLKTEPIGDMVLVAEQGREQILRNYVFDLDNLISSGKLPKKFYKQLKKYECIKSN